MADSSKARVPARRPRPSIAAIVIACAVLGAAGWYVWFGRPASRPPAAPSSSVPPTPTPTATFVGEPSCRRCHEPQAAEWRQSDHFRAMEVATGRSVLGNFENARFTHAGITSTFSRRDDRFFVRTDGPDGALHDYEVKYTFGYRPLQQYLVEFPGGRLQCLPVAWDTRPKAQGGQRWFHLYPGERIGAGDPLHWTGPNQTWNYMCADCHSTNLRRNYDLAGHAYKTEWSEINVSCEACHGPGSAHVAWAEARERRGLSGRDGSGMGLLVQGLRAMDDSGFGPGDAARVAARLAGRSGQRAEIQACAPCHARRGPITGVPDHGKTFLDSYRPALLDDGLYHADGQILEEVYEYASFTQSRMYRAGVTCSDCHDAHSLEQRGTGNTVCLRCHLPVDYDSPAHHHHEPGTEAALCRSCHMRTTTYMVVDPRYDHSMRVPRVDYSVKYGIPNACTTPCHEKKSLQWANAAVVRRYGPTRTRGNDYVAALSAARRRQPDAERQLRATVLDPGSPAIARATALAALGDVLSPTSMDAVRAGVADGDAIVRAAAARVLAQAPEADRWRLGSPLLTDPVRLVRAWAAASLAGTPPGGLTPEESAKLERATAEAVALEMAVAERPEAHVNLSNLHLRQGRTKEAEDELATALRLDPRSVVALVNLADLCRQGGREAEARRHLEKAVEIQPDAAEAVHALGLAYIRAGRKADGIERLARAYKLLPSAPRFGYAYAVGLDSEGKTAEAVAILMEVQRARPSDREVLEALASFEAKRGQWSAAIAWARKLVDLRPDDPAARALLAELQRRRPGGTAPHTPPAR